MWPADTRECPWPLGHVWQEDPEHEGVFACEHCEVGGVPLDEWIFPHARPDQRPPGWRAAWDTLLLRGGRGSGKTRSGAEITNRATEATPRIILIGATGPDLRETMVEGRSGILATAHPTKRPTWEPSRKRLVWPNGCVAQGFSAEEPDRLRGPESGFIWADEPSHYPQVEMVWDNALFGHRVKGNNGLSTKAVCTSTPKPTKWTKDMVADPFTVDRVVSTYANVSNLDPSFKRRILARHEGTRVGRQELYGEILEDVEGALWTWEMIENVEVAPSLERVIVSIDPAGTANKRSDETGIIGMGIAHKTIYVTDDKTGKYSPAGWANAALQLAVDLHADAVVYEKNYGGDMVERVLEAEWDANFKTAHGPCPRLIPVTSRRGKEIRAEPIVGLYEKHMVKHVGEPGHARGNLTKLEDEQTSWVPRESPSPNRVDALVHGATHLAKGIMPVQIANPNELLKHLKNPFGRNQRP